MAEPSNPNPNPNRNPAPGARTTPSPEPVQPSPAVAAANAAAEAQRLEAERIKARDDKSKASFATSADRAYVDGDKPASITVTFTGDPSGKPDPENPEYGGKSFPKGKAVVVDDAAWIRQNGDNIRHNNHFRVE